MFDILGDFNINILSSNIQRELKKKGYKLYFITFEMGRMGWGRWKIGWGWEDKGLQEGCARLRGY